MLRRGVAPSCDHPDATHARQYAVAVTATSAAVSTTKAGSSRAQWFFVCLWYEACLYAVLGEMHSCSMVHIVYLKGGREVVVGAHVQAGAAAGRGGSGTRRAAGEAAATACVAPSPAHWKSICVGLNSRRKYSQSGE